MKTYGTWDAFLVEQLAEQGEVSGYLSAVIEEYQTHGEYRHHSDSIAECR